MLHILTVLLIVLLFVLASVACAIGYQCAAWWRQWQIRRQTKAWRMGAGGAWKDLL